MPLHMHFGVTITINNLMNFRNKNWLWMLCFCLIKTLDIFQNIVTVRLGPNYPGEGRNFKSLYRQWTQSDSNEIVTNVIVFGG